MSESRKLRKLLGRGALCTGLAVATLGLGGGVAAASPLVPFAADEPVAPSPNPNLDTVLAVLSNVQALLPLLTGAQALGPTVTDPTSPLTPLTGPAAVVPGVSNGYVVQP
jgi:hypothetical protein